MAIKIYEQFAPFANPADGDHPYGSFKNDSIPGAEDGTPLDAVWANDMVGFTDALLDRAGIVPSGNPDTVSASQRVDAIKQLEKEATRVSKSGGGSVQDFIDNTENKLTKLEQDIDRFPVEIAIAEVIDQHNNNPLAHPELSAFITSEADRAESAAEAASASGWVYPTVVDGRAARAEGEYFWVVSSGSDDILQLWLEGASSAIDTGKRMLSAAYIDKRFSALHELDVTGEIIHNTLIDSVTGGSQYHVEYKSTPFIDISSATTFLYVGTAFDMTGIAYYDASKTFISGVKASQTGVFLPPTGAKFLRACTKTTLNQNLSVRLTSMPSDRVIDKSGKSISDKLGLMNFTEKDLLSSGIVADTYISATGALVSNVNYSASAMIDCKVGDVFYYTGRAADPARAVALYDATGAFLEIAIGTREGTIGERVIISNPSAAFVACCSSKSSSVGFSFTKTVLNIGADITVTPNSPTKFFVSQKTPSGEIVKHEFVRVVSNTYATDGWYSPWVYHNNVAIAQGNFNFIHQVSPVPMFVGVGHGCEIFKFVQFFLDGKKFDPASLTTQIAGGVFSFQFLSEHFAADPNINAGDSTAPLLPLQVTSEHYMDCSISRDGVSRYNKLIVKRDNTKFSALYGAMQQTNQPVIDGVMTFNAPTPFRTYFPVSPAVSEPYPPSTTEIDGDITLPKINKVIAEGFNNGYYYKIQTECRNLNPSRHNDHSMRIWTSRTTSNKCYFIPELPNTVFNTGDVIEVESFTEYSVTRD